MSRPSDEVRALAARVSIDIADERRPEVREALEDKWHELLALADRIDQKWPTA
ncbi:hypothetical protein LWE61_15055 [Sphingobium sufflavum]|uniref:hypothetical protein n=1 Tax=Sphingobium sufflavum TaxID=1129547 RepID=UPI001F20E9FC|nr:hypothetical protein [Sphingobium sufflavum]MCE7797869.1 hypothetical protein [Sphingobium sufflavum]